MISGKHFDAFFFALHGSFENRADLHLQNFRIRDAQSAAAVSEHRIRFVQLLDAVLHLLERNTDFLCQFALSDFVMGHEFMQRRIDEADRHREARPSP